MLVHAFPVLQAPGSDIAMQAYELLALEPSPGSVTRFSWVLPQQGTNSFQLWPALTDVLRQEAVARVAHVSHTAPSISMLLCNAWHYLALPSLAPFLALPAHPGRSWFQSLLQFALLQTSRQADCRHLVQRHSQGESDQQPANFFTQISY